jgi:hypothetical protein
MYSRVVRGESVPTRLSIKAVTGFVPDSYATLRCSALEQVRQTVEQVADRPSGDGSVPGLARSLCNMLRPPFNVSRFDRGDRLVRAKELDRGLQVLRDCTHPRGQKKQKPHRVSCGEALS